MAATNYGVNHPLAVKLWAKRLAVEALKSTWISKFTGEGSDSLIQIRTETNKGAGDKITCGLRVQLNGAGIQGDGTLEGNEEALTTYNDAITIDQLRHAVRTGGRMSQQRVPFDVREEALAGLKDWWAERMDTWAANVLAGNAAQTDVRYTGLQSATNPDADHLIVGGSETAETSLSATTTHAIKLSDLDKAVAMAKTFGTQPDGSSDGNMPIRPVRIDGDEYFVVCLHPYAVLKLRQDTATTGGWFDLNKAAISGGKYADNPIFKGSLGIYNGCVLHEWSRLPASTKGADYRRGVFMGAQAAAMAFGQRDSLESPNWFEELFDYGNQLGVAGGMISGMKKSVYNSKDFGVITLAGWAPAP